MTEPTAKKTTTAASKKADADASAATMTPVAGVIVVDRRKGKKRKRKYTRGTRTLQRLGDGLTKASFRVPNAVAAGIDSFYKRSRKSSKKKRDGAVRDILRNAAKGVDRFTRNLGKAPNDVARMVPSRRIWRQTRGVVAAAVWPLTGFGLFR